MLLRLALGAAVLLVAAAGVEAVLERLDVRALAGRGRLVESDGPRLRIVQSGRGKPGPAVVLECGIGGATAASWGWVLRGVGEFAPAVAYDRAGLGGSDRGPLPRDGARAIEELHAMLLHSGLTGPYVFVGHSYGGLLVRLYAERWPGEIAGVVLVDSSHPRQFGESRRLPRPFGIIRGALPLAPWAARLGLMRLAVLLLPTDVKQLPEPERREQEAFLSRARHWEGVRDEMLEWHPRTNDEAATTRGFGDAPLVVVSADHGDPRGRWAGFQLQLAALSTNSAHETVAGASHGGLLADSADAARVVEAVRAVRAAALSRGRVALLPR